MAIGLSEGETKSEVKNARNIAEEWILEHDNLAVTLGKGTAYIQKRKCRH